MRPSCSSAATRSSPPRRGGTRPAQADQSRSPTSSTSGLVPAACSHPSLRSHDPIRAADHPAHPRSGVIVGPERSASAAWTLAASWWPWATASSTRLASSDAPRRVLPPPIDRAHTGGTPFRGRLCLFVLPTSSSCALSPSSLPVLGCSCSLRAQGRRRQPGTAATRRSARAAEGQAFHGDCFARVVGRDDDDRRASGRIPPSCPRAS